MNKHPFQGLNPAQIEMLNDIKNRIFLSFTTLERTPVGVDKESGVYLFSMQPKRKRDGGNLDYCEIGTVFEDASVDNEVLQALYPNLPKFTRNQIALALMQMCAGSDLTSRLRAE